MSGGGREFQHQGQTACLHAITVSTYDRFPHPHATCVLISPPFPTHFLVLSLFCCLLHPLIPFVWLNLVILSLPSLLHLVILCILFYRFYLFSCSTSSRFKVGQLAFTLPTVTQSLLLPSFSPCDGRNYSNCYLN